MNSETFNKVSIKKSKQTDDHISSSIRKNYLQKKYEKAMKKNTNPSVLELEDEPPSL
jgi:phosphopantothenoylcysteine synthetase/decarboxylase